MMCTATKMCPRRWFLFMLVPLLGGCGMGGPELAPVRGRVTLDGRPLELADVVFQPEAALSPSYGRTDAEGRYELGYKRGVGGAIVGEHTVAISVSRELVSNPPQIARTELRVTVEPGKQNVFNFDLKSEAK